MPIRQPDPVEHLPRLAMAAGPRMPLMSSGTATFSAAVSVGSRLNAWKTNPMICPRTRVLSRCDIDLKSLPKTEQSPSS